MLRFLRRKRALPADPGPPESPAAGVPVPEPADGQAEELSPLAERLRNLEWPAAPEDVRQRVLDDIMTRVGEDPESRRIAEDGDSEHAA